MNITLKPRFSDKQIHTILRKYYHLQVDSLEILESERDVNVCCALSQDHAGDQKYVLKISHPQEDRSCLEMQNLVLDRLAHSDIGHMVPRVLLSRYQRPIEELSHQDAVYHIRLISFVEGQVVSDIQGEYPEPFLASLGRTLAILDRQLFDLEHEAAHRHFYWDSKHALDYLTDNKAWLEDTARLELLDHHLEQFQKHTQGKLDGLRQSLIHNDANDNNLLYNGDPFEPQLTGIIDFGDAVHSYTICELANACAYMMMPADEPLEAARAVLKSYHQHFPLNELELACLFPLICLRLCLSVSNAAKQSALAPDNAAYLSVSEEAAWALLAKLKDTPADWAHYIFRDACGLEALPQSARLRALLDRHAASFHPVMPNLERACDLDLSITSAEFSVEEMAQPKLMIERLGSYFKGLGYRYYVGGYHEARAIYANDAFASNTARRSIHLGVDVWADAKSQIAAPLPARVHSFADNSAPLDYGPCIILEHELEGICFYSLYGHLSRESLEGLYVGKDIAQGEVFASLGASEVNGGWYPHLHVQLVLDMLGREGEFPGVGLPSQQGVYLSLCPSPEPLLFARASSPPPMSKEHTRRELFKRRQTQLGYNLSLAYKRPLHIVRGERQFLYDSAAQPYLDCVNNVCHIGHSHPKVLGALERQNKLLNTNTRYLHENILDYAEALTATLPDPLSVCFFVNSGSEANDLALRLARAHSQARDIICIDHAYHGHTGNLIDISPYKFQGAGGSGKAPHCHIAPMPDGLRGKYRFREGDIARLYADDVEAIVLALQAKGQRPAAFIAESLLGCGGQLELPPNYLSYVYEVMRQHGVVCIADEVQVGFGRVGSHMWGFETQGVVPDIVTMGKPIGNGHPLAVVVTTPEIASSFANGMEYFNTFGGNPVSAAVGLAVLEVLRGEKLQGHAQRVGVYFKQCLQELQNKYPSIAEVRGRGLFLGIDFVDEHAQPSPKHAAFIKERLRSKGILLSTDGPHDNVIKIKPPLVFQQEDVDRVVVEIDACLTYL